MNFLYYHVFALVFTLLRYFLMFPSKDEIKQRSNFEVFLLIIDLPIYYVFAYFGARLLHKLYDVLSDDTQYFDERDPYKILEIPRDANETLIGKAYRRKALKSHPDKFPEELKADKTKEFLQIAEAYELLNNPITKLNYDKYKRWSFGLTVEEARSMYTTHFGTRPHFAYRTHPASQILASDRALTEEASRNRARRRAIARAEAIRSRRAERYASNTIDDLNRFPEYY